MGIFDGFKRKKKPLDAIETYNFNGQTTTLDGLFFKNGALTEEEILEIPAVQTSLDLITSSIAQLPIKLYRRNKLGDYEEVNDDYRTELLNNEANENITGYDFKKKIAKDVLLYGTSKTVVERENKTSNVISGLYPLDTKDLMIEVFIQDGYKRYGKVHLMSKGGNYTFNDEDLMSVLKSTDNGITGVGIIEQNAKLLKLALAQNEFQTKLLQNGAMPTSVIETDNKLDNTQINRFASAWKQLYSGASNAGKTIILEQGLHFKQASIDPDKLQLTDSTKAVISDIARMFNIPESMINSSANKYNSNEQNNLYFLQYTLSSIMVAIESSITKDLLLESEKQDDLEFRFDPSALLRTTIKEQTDVAVAKFKNGIITNLAAKRAVGEIVTPDEQEYKLGTTGQFLLSDKNHTIINPNTGSVMDSLTGEILQEPTMKSGSVKQSVDDENATTNQDKEVVNNDQSE